MENRNTKNTNPNTENTETQCIQTLLDKFRSLETDKLNAADLVSFNIEKNNTEMEQSWLNDLLKINKEQGIISMQIARELIKQEIEIEHVEAHQAK